MEHLEKQKVYIKTMGCKVNSFDSRVLENKLRAKGYELTSDSKTADIHIINSCSVTQNAEKEARYLLRRYKRENPESLRVITGCYAQIHSSELEKIDEVDFVIPNEVKHELVPLLEKKQSGELGKIPRNVKAVENNRQSQFKTSVVVFDEALSDQTRAYLKVQDGCNGFCAYCQIPYARGASRSVAPQEVLHEVRRLIENKVPEIVVTGIHVGDYGRDFKHTKPEEEPFAELMDSILNVEGIQQVRISSLEPSEVNVTLLETLKNHGSKFCPHFHLPLQSGSNRILKLMRRTYTREEYAETVHLIRKYFPDVNISADVIVGFPQESDEDFEDTKIFLEDLEVASLHVFPYSKRPNTLAQKLPGHIPVEDIKKRVRILRDLSTNLYRNYASKFLNKEVSVLWENSKDSSGRALGKTPHYLSVAYSDKNHPEAGSLSSVTLKGFVDEKILLGV